MLESKIQKRIKAKLQAEGWLVVKITVCSLAGFPDLVAFRSGVVRLIEVKQPGKKPTKLQAHRHRTLANYGFQVEVARSPEDV